MPAQRPQASFEPIPPDFDVQALVEATEHFQYVDRISVDTIKQQGVDQFEKLVLLHVVIGGKPLVVDGFEDVLDPWTFTPEWLAANCGDKVENARNITAKENIPLTIAHYLKNMGLLTNQYFEKPDNYKDKNRQRIYLKDIDCPQVWHDKLREHVPSGLFYLNESTGEIGGPGAVDGPTSNAPGGRKKGRGIARSGDLMSSLPTEMRAENLMCYIGHEGTYTPSHKEMCASLGQNIMVNASGTVGENGKPEKPGSSIWFMTETNDRHLVSEYWLSVLGHDIEVENHFAQVAAWKRAPFRTTMKVAWNRTTVETLEMAFKEALPNARMVCRDEQYKNKAIVYYTLLSLASEH
ncbi:transcription factor jumonji aspartyl beta-hydroxylase [Neofusicoccum parvum]|uniref:Transcription factor jumonji aspartyl beta-hydroxylase n=1 Tax=Neofusicoccum parvum TaxID=310453 RepID=A0ACB5S5Q8_9PEZI|nr:transcription factor jumonji aspartyl beta-hydroxylase [Neofusicoccum parvum]